MAFLDNSGDVILDTVITDLGRMRLAQGNFKITKFSLGDEEINYALYNSSHSSGSAYYDLQIMQTPILEAFTNNASTMNSHLITIPRNNLLHLPVMKINTIVAPLNTNGAYYLAVDSATQAAFAASNVTQGIINGETLGGGNKFIRVDQGIDSSEVSFAIPLENDLVEVSYVVEIDNRMGKLVSVEGAPAKVSYIDDDQIASYYFSSGTDANYVKDVGNQTNNTNQVIAGPRGTYLQFSIQSSLDLNTSNFLFQQLGTTGVAGNNAQFGIAATYLVDFIDSYIKITGATTGNTLFVPWRAVKVQ
jgi:hypothetical protein